MKYKYSYDNTIHSKTEQNQTDWISIVDEAGNYGQNRIVISFVQCSPAKPTITILKQRTSIQILENNY